MIHEKNSSFCQMNFGITDFEEILREKSFQFLMIYKRMIRIDPTRAYLEEECFEFYLLWCEDF